MHLKGCGAITEIRHYRVWYSTIEQEGEIQNLSDVRVLSVTTCRFTDDAIDVKGIDRTEPLFPAQAQLRAYMERVWILPFARGRVLVEYRANRGRGGKA